MVFSDFDFSSLIFSIIVFPILKNFVAKPIIIKNIPTNNNIIKTVFDVESIIEINFTKISLSICISPNRFFPRKSTKLSIFVRGRTEIIKIEPIIIRKFPLFSK